MKYFNKANGTLKKKKASVGNITLQNLKIMKMKKFTNTSIQEMTMGEASLFLPNKSENGMWHKVKFSLEPHAVRGNKKIAVSTDDTAVAADVRIFKQ